MTARFVCMVAALFASTAAAPAPASAPWLCYPPPVVAPVVEPYVAPACTYCAGHIGVVFGPTPGTAVTALADGTVVFAGQVAGVRWVVVEQDDGLRSTYGRLGALRVAPDQRVVAGQQLGISTDRVYLGLRQQGRPIDPTRLLGVWRTRPRLVPDGPAARRPGPKPRLTCTTPPLVR